MQLDQAMNDLREIFSKIEVKVSEPFALFQETVSDASAIKSSLETPNRKNRIDAIAEPLKPEIA